MARYRGGSTAEQVEREARKEKEMLERRNAGTKVKGEEVKPVAGVETKLAVKPKSKSEIKPEVPKVQKAHRTAWFVISRQDMSPGIVLYKGDKLKCVEFIADFSKTNPKSTMSMYLAHGLQILG